MNTIPLVRCVILITTIVTTGIPFCLGQEGVFDNKTFSDHIHTVQIHPDGAPLAFPALALGSAARLRVSFDELAESPSDYSYTLLHCNADWTPNNLDPIEFMGPFYEDDITDYAFSVNTMFDYIHYSFTIPNDKVSPLLSGNYLVKVYPKGQPEEPILIRRFYVFETGLQPLDIVFSRPIGQKQWETGQELQFKYNFAGIKCVDPVREFRAVIMQNSRPDRQINQPKPKYDGSNLLDYNTDSHIVFDGEREFRRFEIKSLKYNAKGIDSIRYQVPWFHAYIAPATPYIRGPYYYNEDLNGRYYIDLESMDNDSVQADYVYVHFALAMPLYDTENDYYVTGAWADWHMDESTRMTFEYQTKSYKATALLKQGFYDYAFYARNKSTGKVWFPEKSFYETENNYQLLLYHLSPYLRYHRLVSFSEVNSLEKSAN